MRIETLRLRNFRCFGPDTAEMTFEPGLTTLIGSNGSGKTAAIAALSCLFGVTQGQRALSRRDFHVPPDEEELQTGASLALEVVFLFPEVDEEEPEESGIPEFFSQMAVEAPGADLKARMRLEATWTDDGTPEGSIDSEIRWIQTLGDDFDWEDCPRVAATERAAIQLIYVPASRDASKQVNALLKGRLWQAARWSDSFRENSAKGAEEIQEQFLKEKPAKLLSEKIAKRWRQVHEADTHTTPRMQLVEGRFEELIRKAGFVFYPDEEGKERELAELSDGQRSLFHIALTAATLEVEREAQDMASEEGSFEHERLRTAHLTILAIEEPENSLAPFFLSRILEQAREIGALPSAQVVMASHSPAILGRVEPGEIRFLRMEPERRASNIRRLTLPESDAAAQKYVRLAVRAYPELYFARLVILAEGDSERLVIPRLSSAMGVPLDPSFVPVVPLGGRYVEHFWQLLGDLEIPFVTLLDLDLGRSHGGARAIRGVLEVCEEAGRDPEEESDMIRLGMLEPDDVADLEDEDLADLEDEDESSWLRALEELGVFFSYPLDLDFSMLESFPDAYQRVPAGRAGPKFGAKAITASKSQALKTGGTPDLYSDDFDETFVWYRYLFLRRSKPETHLAALAELEDDELRNAAPGSLRRLVTLVAESVGIAAGSGEAS